jgi:hypothetical protein
MKSPLGIRVEAKTTDAGIEARIVVAEGVKLDQPVHLCMGLSGPFGEQDVRLVLTLEARAAPPSQTPLGVSPGRGMRLDRLSAKTCSGRPTLHEQCRAACLQCPG